MLYASVDVTNVPFHLCLLSILRELISFMSSLELQDTHTHTQRIGLGFFLQTTVLAVHLHLDLPVRKWAKWLVPRHTICLFACLFQFSTKIRPGILSPAVLNKPPPVFSFPTTSATKPSHTKVRPFSAPMKKPPPPASVSIWPIPAAWSHWTISLRGQTYKVRGHLTT